MAVNIYLAIGVILSGIAAWGFVLWITINHRPILAAALWIAFAAPCAYVGWRVWSGT